MTNNKPTSLGEFLFELIKGGYINRLPAKEFQQARRVHKEEIEKAYFAGFHCCEKASVEVATPTSAIPAALASAATSKKGSAVVITLSCEFTL